MSTVSYLRSALIRAEKRLGKYEARRDELQARLVKDPNARNSKALQNLEADPSYQAAKDAVVNLTAALAREESRLYANPSAAL